VDSNPLKAKKKNLKLWLIACICLTVVLAGAWMLRTRLEGEKPLVVLELDSLAISESQAVSVTVSDPKSGVRRIWVGLIKDGKEAVLFEKQFPRAGLLGGGKVHQTSFNIQLEPSKVGITDGKAILRMVAVDFSWRGWWNGNRTYVEQDIVIDTRPPELEILTRVHNVSQGGSGLVIYKLSEPCPKSGVHVGHNFFQGYPGYFNDMSIFMAFFSFSYNQGSDTELFLKATDYAGNSAISGFPYYLKKRVFKKDMIHISDSFLKKKMPEFYIDVQQNPKTSKIEKFLKVNSELRQSNYKKIETLVEKTDSTLYWDDAFLRLPNSARRASFADHRTYKYKGNVIDQQVHLGIDLASTAHSQVPASNSGKVVFVGPLGIYGRTVIIDHGFGLFSTYSHLSAINVAQGQMLAKGEIIGRTGSTGLAGGDHLHFGMLVHNVFVNPVEWWDAKWIENNISTKIDTVKSLIQ
jgi:hypothetical protein